MSESSEPIYLDYAATTPIDPRVLEAMMPYLTDKFGNASSRDHAFGWDARDAVELARYYVSGLVNATPNEIIFTGSATESINMVLKGLAWGNKTGKKRIVTTLVEHSAVLETCRQLEQLGLAEIDCAPVDRKGRIDVDDICGRICSGETLLVAVMHANNEIGNLYPIREIARLAHERGSLFFTDASQTVGKIPVDVRAEGIDLMAFSAHKMYGPKGVGGLFIRSGDAEIELVPLISGGGQERGHRSGTHNVAGIVGFGEACRIAAKTLPDHASKAAVQIRDEMESTILSLFRALDCDVSINGDLDSRLPTISHLTLQGIDAARLIKMLHPIAIGTRSACSTDRREPSHVLKAMGFSKDQTLSSIRISLGQETVEANIDSFLMHLKSAVTRLVQET